MSTSHIAVLLFLSSDMLRYENMFHVHGYFLLLFLAKCEGNVSSSWEADDAPNPLTPHGRLQADSLGKDWASTHIDRLLSSPHQRAHDTAKALLSHNEGHPEIIIDPKLVERRYGGRVHRLMQRNSTAAREELTGRPWYSRGSISRVHCPAEGGESMEMVARRAESIIYRALADAVKLSEPPEFFLEKKTIDTPDVLPDGIPHVVIVSHNVFLMELYEKLYSWGREHSETECDWKNADW
jgi:probable phosphoglycerate mutase